MATALEELCKHMDGEPTTEQRIAALERRMECVEIQLKTLEARPDTTALEVRIQCLEQLLQEPDDDEFSTFWKAYPRKVAVAAARKAFKTARKKAPLDELLAGLERYKVDKPAEHPWKHASTWLNGECWQDRYEETLSSSAPTSSSDANIPEPSPEVMDALRAVLVEPDPHEKDRKARLVWRAYLKDKNIRLACGTLKQPSWMNDGAYRRAKGLFQQSIEDVAAKLDPPIIAQEFAWPEIKT